MEDGLKMDGIIDMHTHYLPKRYTDALKQHIPGDPDGWPTPAWNEQVTLKFMKKQHISYSLLSLSSPHFNFGNKDETLAIARDANEVGDDLTQRYPDQLGYLASLPLPYEQESVQEIDWALAHRARGFTVPTNTRGLYFGTPIFDRVYQQLNQAKAIVALHPNQPAALPQNVNIDLPTPLMGFFMDTTMAFMNLLKYHFFDRFPDIKLIVPHAGAFMGILADRDAMFVKSAYRSDLYAAMQHVYFDTAGAVMPRQLPMLLTLADRQHIMYGSDIPYTDLATSSKLLAVLVNAEMGKAARQMTAINALQKYDAFFEKHHQFKQLPTLLQIASQMMTGAEVLTPALKQAILRDNARQLLTS